jgi:hypothetical protein
MAIIIENVVKQTTEKKDSTHLFGKTKNPAAVCYNKKKG